MEMVKEIAQTDALKQQIYLLIDQLADADLYRLLSVLNGWISEYKMENLNGVHEDIYENGSSQFSEAAKETYPWLKNIEKLSDSPNKDIFLEEMAKIRAETNKIE